MAPGDVDPFGYRNPHLTSSTSINSIVKFILSAKTTEKRDYTLRVVTNAFVFDVQSPKSDLNVSIIELRVARMHPLEAESKS